MGLCLDGGVLARQEPRRRMDGESERKAVRVPGGKRDVVQDPFSDLNRPRDKSVLQCSDYASESGERAGAGTRMLRDVFATLKWSADLYMREKL